MTPKKPPAADQAASIDSFCPPPEQELTVLRRSELERWSICPAMARACESSGKRIVLFKDSESAKRIINAKNGGVIRVEDPSAVTVIPGRTVNTSSDIANAGQEVHEAISLGIQYYLDSENRMEDDFSRRMMQEAIEVALLKSRPDVQPDAIEGLRRSVYAITDHIFNWNHPINPNLIHRYDGGEGERSGQLAWDMPDLGVRLTSELDLLYESETPETWVDMDWKSGHKGWTAGGVKVSFQFGMHAWLVFRNYEQVETLIVTIWNTRKNVKARDVEFRRENINQYEYRLRSAVEIWRQYRDTPASECPTWPSIEKCTICNARRICPMSGAFDGTPEKLLGRVVALRAQLKALEDDLTAIADERGEDIVWEDARWGRHGPKAEKKSPAKLYEVKKS